MYKNNEIVSSGLNYVKNEIHDSFDTFKIVDINDEIMFNESIMFNYNEYLIKWLWSYICVGLLKN